MDEFYLGRIRGKRAVFTTMSPQSHYGIPVLRIEDEGAYDLGPGDLIGDPPNIQAAADVVVAMIRKRKRVKAELIEAANLWLGQLPEGPQIKIE